MTTIKNPKQVSKKSRTHTVRPLGGDSYLVTSGHSGNAYNVRITPQGGYCDCPWASYRPLADRRSGCSHAIAVYNWLAEQEGRKVSAWNSPEDARRQHRPSVMIGDGLTLTLRKAT